MSTTPSMQTHIKRHRLYATVTITDKTGLILTTTLNRGVRASDERISRLKCSLAHVHYEASQ